MKQMFQEFPLTPAGGKDVTTERDLIELDDLPPRVVDIEKTSERIIEEAALRKLSLEDVEREYIRSVLASVSGNKTEAASILRIDRKTLARKLDESSQPD